MFGVSGPPGGTKLLTLNFTNAFLTGKIPGDCSFLIPRISILTSKSLNSTLSLNRTLLTGTLKLKSVSTTQKEHKTPPQAGSPSLK